MQLSGQARYAIAGLFDLAYNGDGEPVQVRVVGERQGIPERYLEQIFRRLRRAGLVEARRGPGGGYRLARPAAEITLRDVVEAVEGPLDAAAKRARRADATPHHPSFLWPQVATALAETLAGTSLEEVCRRAARAAVPRANDDARMWFI